MRRFDIDNIFTNNNNTATTRAAQPTERRTAFFLPNIFTVGNLALGFFSLVATMDKRYTQAATAIILAHLCDILDGRIARWTKATSRFGVEFDSLADCLSFGVAPALLIYNAALRHYKFGWLLSLLFLLCGTLRLARFNAKTQDNEASAHFTGLPIPAAGGLLAVIVMLYDMWADGNVRKIPLLIKQVPLLYQLIPVLVFALSILMVSRLRYSSFKKINIFKPKSLRALLFTIFVGFMIYTYPQSAIFMLYCGYILWGAVEPLFHKQGEQPANERQYNSIKN